VVSSNDADEATFTLQLAGFVKPRPQPPLTVHSLAATRKLSRMCVKVTLQNMLDETFRGPVTFTVSTTPPTAGAVPAAPNEPVTKTVRIRPHRTRVVPIVLPIPLSQQVDTVTVTIRIGDATSSLTLVL
jgi:hypothetical protein